MGLAARPFGGGEREKKKGAGGLVWVNQKNAGNHRVKKESLRTTTTGTVIERDGKVDLSARLLTGGSDQERSERGKGVGTVDILQNILGR